MDSYQVIYPISCEIQYLVGQYWARHYDLIGQLIFGHGFPLENHG